MGPWVGAKDQDPRPGDVGRGKVIPLENKHSEKRKLKKEVKQICIELRRNLSLIILNTVLHQTRIAVKSRLKSISKRHENKLFNYVNNNSLTKAVMRMLIITLRAPGLDHHIPNKLNRNRIHTLSLNNFTKI